MAKNNYEDRLIFHGTENGAFAEITKKADDTIDDAVVPVIFTGLRGVSDESESEATNFYADDTIHASIYGTETTSGELTVYQIPEAFATAHLGKKTTANGGLVNTGSKKPFIFQFIEKVNSNDGNEYEKLTIYYSVMAGSVSTEAATDEDSVEPKEYTIPLTMTPSELVKDADGKAITKYEIVGDTDEKKAIIDLAYTKILLPDEIV